MRKPVRIFLLVLLGLLVLTPPAAYWAIDAWLESSGGRQMLEKSLSARIGMKVILGGEFDLMLLPDIGVSGTDLRIESAFDEGPFAISSEYEISVALRPLFRKQLLADWIRLTGGEVHPGRYRPGPSPQGSDGGGPVQLPEIGELTIRDFRLVPPGEETGGIRLDVLEVSGFADRRSAPFIMEIRDLVSARGRVLLDAGNLSLELRDLSLERSGQRLAGNACVNFGDPFSLHLVLHAEQLDLDELRNESPDIGAWAGEGEESAPLDIRVRVRVDQLLAAGAVARGAVLSVGREPVCGSG